MREPSYCASATTGQRRREVGGAALELIAAPDPGKAGVSALRWAPSTLRSLLVREADGLAADRVGLAQRVALPVLGHEQALEVRVAVELDSHQVVLLPLVPVAGWPDRDDARHVLALVDPALEPGAWCALTQREQVVADGEALRLELGQHLESLGHGMHEVAAGRGSDVAGDALAAPAEVVGGDDVDTHVEAELVARVLARLADPLRLD